MRTASLLATLLCAALLSSITANAAEPIVCSKYLTGSVSHDAAGALARGAAEHKPVWIVAIDEKFRMSAAGKGHDNTGYTLGYFYQNPDAKALVSKNFIQVFTTTSNPAITQWIDPADATHEPMLIVIGADGVVLKQGHHYANPEVGLKTVQDVVAKASAPMPTQAPK